MKVLCLHGAFGSASVSFEAPNTVSIHFTDSVLSRTRLELQSPAWHIHRCHDATWRRVQMDRRIYESDAAARLRRLLWRSAAVPLHGH
jgi:hypothetical protein